MTDVYKATHASIKLVNATRTSLAFQVPGRSITLMPGESVDLSRPYLDVQEIRVLVQQGALVVRPPPAALAAATPPAEASEDASSTLAANAGAEGARGAKARGGAPRSGDPK